MTKISRAIGLIIAFNLAACGSKTDTPEPTLETACPQVKTTATKIVKSNYPPSQESDPVIKITGDLTHDDEGLLDATTSLISLAESKERPDIRIYVASGGGETNQGFALRDVVKYYGEDKFVIVCTTQAASAASFIFATKAKRFALPSCEIVTHAVSGSIVDEDKIPKEKLKRIKATLEITQDLGTKQMRELYKNSFNLTDTCANYLTRKDDTYLSAYDALKLGFFDAVLEPNGKMTIKAPQPAAPK
jgi:ATP-dependent Clp protease protease subunit